jgi:gluconate kinase
MNEPVLCPAADIVNDTGHQHAAGRAESIVRGGSHFSQRSYAERMRDGIGLTNEDRWRWPVAVCDGALAERRAVVFACSVQKTAPP